jgi:hypothetical protein
VAISIAATTRVYKIKWVRSICEITLKRERKTSLGGLRERTIDVDVVLVLVVLVVSAMRLSPLGTAATIGRLYSYQHWMIDVSDCGLIGGIKIGR